MGKARYTTKETVVCLQRPSARLPEFAVRPGGTSWLSRDLFEVFTGPTDINFESHPAFSNSYLLRGDDEAEIRKLFHKGVLEFFEKQRQLSIYLALHRSAGRRPSCSSLVFSASLVAWC